jgi:hypothetical protein
MRSTRKARALVAAAAIASGALVEIGAFQGTAHAIIGRPLTPMSYAGVARRTTRRAAAYGAYGAYGAYPAVPPAPVVVW